MIDVIITTVLFTALACFGGILLIVYLASASVDREAKRNGEKTSEELKDDLNKAIDDMQTEFWQDGFERGYEFAYKEINGGKDEH